MTQQEACREYIAILKRYEKLTPAEIFLAQESFREGWLQRERSAMRELAP